MIYEGLDLERKAVRLETKDGRILRRSPIEAGPGMPRLLPVLVDLQHNGALSHSYNELDEKNAEQNLEDIAEHLLRHGTGRVHATFTTLDYETLKNGARSFAAVLDRNSRLNTLFAGIFHEGVFISPEYGWRGDHAEKFIRKPDWDLFRQFDECSGGRTRMVNIAPEAEGAFDFIRDAVKTGILISLGHGNPPAETIHRAADLGASMITHFGNGAAPMIPRFLNPFWGFLDDTRLNAGLIGDGFHLQPEIVRTALRCKGVDHCFMVSDACRYSGCPPGRYHRATRDCTVEENGFLHVTADKKILSGAWFQLDRGVDFLVRRCGLDFEAAWKLCSVTPASLAGIELPDLSEGAEASFVVYSDGKIQKTVFKGEEWIPENDLIRNSFEM